MTQTLPIPPINVPFLDAQGYVRPEWYMAISRSFGSAQGTADIALADAEMAQGTADQAIIDASDAQTTANQAIVNAATADGKAVAAQSAADAAQGTADQAVTDAAAAQADVDALEVLQYVLTTATPSATPNARQLTGSTGLTINTATPGLAQLVLNVITALGYTPANKAGDTFSGPVDVQALLTCDSLRIDQTPTATLTLSDASIPINCNGTTYYMRLSTLP